MKLHSGRYRWERGRWHEFAIGANCAIGAMALALWQTLVFAFLLARRCFWSDIYTQMADVHNSVFYAWVLFLLTGLAVGVSCCCLAIVWLRSSHPSIAAGNRLKAWLQAVASLTVTSSYLVLLLRVTTSTIMVGAYVLPLGLQGPLVEETGYEMPAPEYPFYLLASALVLIYSLLQARASLRYFAQAQRGLVLFLILALAVAGPTLLLGPPRAGTLVTPFGFASDGRLSEEDWAVLRGDSSTSEVLRTYWSAFGPFDSPARDIQMRMAARRHNDGLPCRVCILPRTPFLALRGIPILLDDAPPHEPEPSLVVEVLGNGCEYRVYPPDQSAATAINPIDQLGPDLRGSQWILLKANAQATGDRFRGVLESFKQHGVRKVTLAGFPVGVMEIPNPAALVTTGDCSEFVPYWDAPPPPGTVLRRRRRMIVRQFVPPGAQNVPPPRCPYVDSRDLRQSSLGPPFHLEGTLPQRISISGYHEVQDVVDLYSRAWYGGAREICLGPQLVWSPTAERARPR